MKSIKKLLAVILALTFVMGLGTVGVQAKNAILYQKYGCTVDFNGYTISNDYGYLCNADSDYSARILNNTTNNIAIAEAEGPDKSNALKFASNTEKSKGNFLFYYNGDVEVTAPIKISFSIRFDATSGLPFYFYYRKGDDSVKMTKWSGNKVEFAGKEITTYENEKWYDVELIINPTAKYGRYSMKETGTEQWSSYDVFSADSTIITSITGANRLYFGFEGSTASTGNAYLDNLSASVATAEEAMLPLSAYNDNFEGDSGYLTTGATTADWTKSWFIGNTSSVSNTALSGVAGKVMNLATNATESATVYSSADKRVDFAATPSLIHHFKFKLGGTLDEGKKQFILNLVTKIQSVIYIQNEKVYINSREVGAFAQENKLYDCEVIFDDSTDFVYAAITDSNGKRYSSVFATNASSYLQRIIFQNMSTVNYSTNMYVDDFEWDVYEKNQLTFERAELKSGANDSANLDDEVSFTYQGASIRHNANVAVTKDGTAVDASKYTVTAKNNVYTVSFNKLEKGGKYTVTLSGVKSLFDEEIAENSITFTAASTGVTATAPTVAENIASTTVTSYYSKGKTVCLLVALYDASGRITEVVMTEALADARDGEIVSIDLSGKTYATARAFIWSELSKMVPIEIAQ